MDGSREAELPDCRTCGACCSYSREWPRFALESDEALARIPERFTDRRLHRMRCDGERCSALTGEVGVRTGCAVYEVRPDVCRECQPGDDACLMARRRFGL
ncbi:YkgJ family cysteine cluster protein [Marinimicrococcus flavescens]|uniref:YkgJ family cysteine cluster protein n=1 Tax=Marinimicrococcus flavescens TaxID=3031815 RepID=A0AAP3XTA8_9PROT|nr:YkgJ family cysteine cluster protein [Marinimicrococcus flavescens]